MALFDRPECASCLTVKELTTLYEIASIISNHYDLDTSLEKSIKILKNSLHLTNCTVHVLEDEELKVFASVDLSRIQKNLQLIKLEKG